jgi:hypothetical protein
MKESNTSTWLALVTVNVALWYWVLRVAGASAPLGIAGALASAAVLFAIRQSGASNRQANLRSSTKVVLVVAGAAVLVGALVGALFGAAGRGATLGAIATPGVLYLLVKNRQTPDPDHTVRQ